MGPTGNAEIDGSDADFIIGSDEAGYGAWAGPLVVCATIVPREWPLNPKVRDSKKLTPASRLKLATEILRAAISNVIMVSPKELDAKGVYPCLLEAHAKAIQIVLTRHQASGAKGKELVIVDGNLPILGAISLPKADDLVPAVSAASIVGKVYRDQEMIKLATEFPGYGFEKHKGYGVPQHRTALEKLGPCDIHRKSYAPIARLLQPEEDDEPREAWLFEELEP